MNSAWARKFGATSTAFASGWMRIRGMRRRKNVDRGFVVSDHVDWPGLLETIRATGAERVIATHGSSEALARWLRESGTDSLVWRTAWEGEAGAEESGSRGTEDPVTGSSNEAGSSAQVQPEESSESADVDPGREDFAEPHSPASESAGATELTGDKRAIHGRQRRVSETEGSDRGHRDGDERSEEP
jgi:hypothetical protein